MSNFRVILLSGSALILGSLASIAQQPPAPPAPPPAAMLPAQLPTQTALYDPQQLPSYQGQVAQYSLTGRGDVDGLILQDGTQIHLPPHLGSQIVQIFKPGDSITVHGLKAQALPLIQAISVTNDASGQTVADNGPPQTPPQPVVTGSHWLEVQGNVRQLLYGPAGDMNGALLEDGTQIHMPPDRAWSFGSLLQVGKPLKAQGYGVESQYGKSLDAWQIGDSGTRFVQAPPPPGGPGVAPPPPPPGGPAQRRHPHQGHLNKLLEIKLSFACRSENSIRAASLFLQSAFT